MTKLIRLAFIGLSVFLGQGCASGVLDTINIEESETLPSSIRPGDRIYVTTKAGEEQRIRVADPTDGKTIRGRLEVVIRGTSAFSGRPVPYPGELVEFDVSQITRIQKEREWQPTYQIEQSKVRPGDSIYVTTKAGERQRILVDSSDGITIKGRADPLIAPADPVSLSNRRDFEFEVAQVAKVEVDTPADYSNATSQGAGVAKGILGLLYPFLLVAALIASI